MPSFEDLILRVGDVITQDWYERLVDHLNKIAFQGAVDYYGYVRSDLIPIADLALNLGTKSKRFLNVFAAYGYMAKLDADKVQASDVAATNINTNAITAKSGSFDETLTLQGKQVLKDGDPIYVADLYQAAYEKITYAIDVSKVADYIADIKADIDLLLNYRKPELLAYEVNAYATAMAPIFASDVVVARDGRVRVKMLSDVDVYAYLSWRPSGFTDVIDGLLNRGEMVHAMTWHEEDFTVRQGDKVNVKVYPDAKVTVFIYNIGEA